MKMYKKYTYIAQLAASLQRGKTRLNECSRYNTKQSDGEVPVILELWEMQSTPLLPSLSGQLWPTVVAPDRVLIYGSNRTKLCIFAKLDCMK